MPWHRSPHARRSDTAGSPTGTCPRPVPAPGRATGNSSTTGLGWSHIQTAPRCPSIVPVAGLLQSPVEPRQPRRPVIHVEEIPPVAMHAAREVSQAHPLDLVVQCLELSRPDTVLLP